MDVGFSPNDHTDLKMVGYPVVEIMAAIGLTHARPLRLGRDKLAYRYGVPGCTPSDGLLDPNFLRAALGCAVLPFPRRTFTVRLGWPGKEGQARCIIDVQEEPQP